MNNEFHYIESFDLIEHNDDLLIITSQSDTIEEKLYSKIISYDLLNNEKLTFAITNLLRNIFIYIDNNEVFIVGMNNKFVMSISYCEIEKNRIERTYDDKTKNKHYNILIQKIDKVLKLFETCFDGFLRIWDFYSVTLLKKIKLDNEKIYDICFFNNNLLFFGANNGKINLIILDKEEIVFN